MIRLRSLVTLAAVAIALPVSLTVHDTQAAAQAKAPLPQDPPAVSLFDGKTLDGWRGYKKEDATGSRWAVADGTLTLPAGNARAAGDIITRETFDLFDLTWEWKIAQGGNSGLKYFVVEDGNSAIGHEYQLIDDERHPDAKIGPHRQTAAFYDVLQAHDRPIKPAGEWNASEVIVRGMHVEHILNGKNVLEYDLDSPALSAAIAKSKFKDVARFGKPQNGHILVQDHGDQVWYRKIEIQRIK